MQYNGRARGRSDARWLEQEGARGAGAVRRAPGSAPGQCAFGQARKCRQEGEQGSDSRVFLLLSRLSLSLSRSRSRFCSLSLSLLPSLTLSPQDKIIEVYNKVFEDGLITSEADREAARSSR